MDLVIGFENFGEVIQNQLDFVDKTLFIKEILDDRATKVALITRPRRFGKTFNLSMLHHFLTHKVGRLETKDLFKGLKISQAGEEYTEHQGKYPVVFVTFKDVKENTFGKAYEKLSLLMAEIYTSHRYLLLSPNLYEEDKRLFEQILNRQTDNFACFQYSI